MAMKFIRAALLLRILGTAIVAVSLAACGDDGDEGGRSADCTTLCTEGQQGNCTTIKGDCGQFCTALDRAAPTAGCKDKRDAYISCLNGDSNVCNVNCDSSESALEQCMGLWCATHASDADCQTLLSSF